MSVSTSSMIYGTKMITRSLNEIYNSVDISYSLLTDTTINYKYNNFNSESPMTVPKILYGGIGIRGCYNTDDESGVSPYQPEADELDLYTPIPFRCVPIDEDLSDLERASYRMRVKQTYYGSEYYCYYLKTLRVASSEVNITKIDPVSKEEEDFIINTANLNPIPVKPVVSGETSSVPTEIMVTIPLELSISGSEVLEAINIIYNGDYTKARLSEYGLYSGEDRVVQGYTSEGGLFNYTEAIYTQLAYKYCTGGTAIETNDQDITRSFSFGNGSNLLL